MKVRALRAAICVIFVAALGHAASFEELSARATAARQANDIPHAIEFYRQALQLNSKWDEGWWFLGSLSYDTDQYADGRDALAHFVELQPNAAPAWGLLGLCEFETGDYAQSLAHIQHSLSLATPADPQMDVVLRYHEALLLTRTGDFDKALQKYARFAHDGAPNNSILLSMGLATLRRPLLPKDIPAGQQDLFVTAGKAAFLTMAGHSMEGEQAFEDLLARFPNAENVHYAHGLTLLATDPDQAIEEFKRELQIDAANPAANSMLAWVLLRRSEFQPALPYAERAAKEEPKSAIAQFVFGRLLVETGAVARGIEHLETAEKLDSGFLESHLSLATAYSRIGRTQDARRERQISMDLTKETASLAQR